MKTGLTLIALATSLTLGACASASAKPAHYHTQYAHAGSGQWVLNPNRCPDLVEDRRDRRESRRDEAIDWSARDVREDIRDRRESRRDEAVTICPASAWEWRGPAYKAHYHAPRPKKIKVYYNHGHRHHYHHRRGKRVTIRW